MQFYSYDSTILYTLVVLLFIYSPRLVDPLRSILINIFAYKSRLQADMISLRAAIGVPRFPFEGPRLSHVLIIESCF